MRTFSLNARTFGHKICAHILWAVCLHHFTLQVKCVQLTMLNSECAHCAGWNLKSAHSHIECAHSKNMRIHRQNHVTKWWFLCVFNNHIIEHTKWMRISLKDMSCAKIQVIKSSAHTLRKICAYELLCSRNAQEICAFRFLCLRNAQEICAFSCHVKILSTRNMRIHKSCEYKIHKKYAHTFSRCAPFAQK